MTASALDRQALYRRLARRNRIVGVLRLALPLFGLVVLLLLSRQIYLSSIGGRFGIGQISVTPDSVAVDAPEYAGLLEDGSSYRVWASLARAATARTDLIDLTDAALLVTDPLGTGRTAEAPEAQLDTANQQVLIPGTAQIGDSTGTEGTLVDSVFDWSAQVLKTRGPVAIDYADGTSVRAQGLVYDARARVWTFTRALVTLPETPGTAVTGENPEPSGEPVR